MYANINNKDNASYLVMKTLLISAKKLKLKSSMWIKYQTLGFSYIRVKLLHSKFVRFLLSTITTTKKWDFPVGNLKNIEYQTYEDSLAFSCKNIIKEL